jgi:hypothetical protein
VPIKMILLLQAENNYTCEFVMFPLKKNACSNFKCMHVKFGDKKSNGSLNIILYHP